MDPLARLPFAQGPRDVQDALLDTWHRAERERVEVACAGGEGRTGTALACLAVLDGVPAQEAARRVD